MNTFPIINLTSVCLFGLVLAARFCDICWTRRKKWIMAVCISVMMLFQGIVLSFTNVYFVRYFYPLITHVPLTIVLCLLKGEFLWPVIAVLTAYLCCQLRRWTALLAVAVFSGSSMLQSVLELAVTLPLLVILLRFIAPSVRSLSHYPASVQFQFGLVPALYYGFDYVTRIYTRLLADGNMAALEFMPFVCSVAYLMFVFRASAEKQLRSQLEETQKCLNLQIVQAVREIEALRESQRKTSIYRHDLRHHMQYLSSCIENGRYGQAKEYIQEICSGIEGNQVRVFCQNEVANLIFSAFAGRAGDFGIRMEVRAGLSQTIAVSESDLCVLLCNALENALHACQKQKRRGVSGSIEVTMYEKSRKILLQITNSCDADILFDHGVPVSMEAGHGQGVRSICAVVEKYGGIYDFSARDGKFTLNVSL